METRTTRERITHILRPLRRYWLTVAFLLGFMTDLILLDKVDSLVDNAILLFYVLLSTVALVTLYIGIAERASVGVARFLRVYSPLAIQYAFGGLLSGMLIFYGRSGDIFASWPFLLLVVGAIAGNELVSNRAQRLVFNLSIYFIGLFSYLVLVIAVFSGRTEPWVFFASGLLALGLVFLLVKVLRLIIPRFIQLQMRALVFSLGIIFVTINALYITSILPPIPLSLKEITIAQSVVRYEATGEFEVRHVPVPWWNISQHFNQTFNPTAGGGVACFTNVFAPVRLQTTIEHVWEYQNPTSGQWEEYFALGYQISGSATDGYRGYTAIQNFQPGQWRCVVQTTRGQVLGQQRFVIDISTTPTDVETRVE